MFLGNAEFEIMLSPIKVGKYGLQKGFLNIYKAFKSVSPEYFKITDSTFTEYGKYFHLKGEVAPRNDFPNKMIEEIKQICAGLIEEGHGKLTVFSIGGPPMTFKFSFEGIPARETSYEDEKDLDI